MYLSPSTYFGFFHENDYTLYWKNEEEEFDQLVCSEDLRRRLQAEDLWAALLDRLRFCRRLEEGVAEVRATLEEVSELWGGPPDPLLGDDEDFVAGLAGELAALCGGVGDSPWSVVSVSGDWHHLVLEVVEDGGERRHSVDFRWTGIGGGAWTAEPCVPPSAPEVSLSPSPKAVSAASLSACAAACSRELRRWRPFWDEMDQVDLRFWVLEPALPAARSATRRRLALRGGAAVDVVVRADHARDRPERVLWVGPAREARRRWAARAGAWDQARPLAENLAALLGDEAPRREGGARRVNLEHDCGICYRYLLLGKGAPDMACAFDKCRRPYHSACVRAWLESLGTTIRSFDTLFGKCPYCQESLSCGV